MVTELVLLLALLGFLSIRNDFVKRPLAFVVAMLFWGGARLSAELAFGGQYEYSWGSLPSVVSAVGLLLCLLFMYLACAGAKHGTPRRAESTRRDEPQGQKSLETPSERIRNLMDDEQGT